MASRYRFDDVEIDTQSFRLLKSGKAVPVEPKTLNLLIFLIENRTRLLVRREILDAVWQEAFVTDHVLNRAIGQLRKALSDDAKEPRYIETVPTRGYRFIGHIEEQPEGKTGGLATAQHVTVVTTNLEAPPAAQPDVSAPPVEDIKAQVPPSPVPEKDDRRRPVLLSILAVGLGILLATPLLLHLARRHEATGPPLSNPPVEQRITSNSPEAPVNAASVSPDGKFVAFSDSTGLYLRHIASGETRSWRLPKDLVATPNSWFPDGTHLLVTCTADGSRRPSLWKLSLLGSTPRMLKANAAAGVVSPDGLRIAYLAGSSLAEDTPTSALETHGVGTELWLMDSEGTNPRQILSTQSATATISGSRIRALSWSPHGQRLAYIERHGLDLNDPTVDSFSLRTLNVNGGEFQDIVGDAQLKPALAWAPDGRVLFAYKEDSNSERNDQELRSVLVDEGTGKAIGKPLRVTHNEGQIGGVSVSADGKRSVLWRMNTQPQAFLSTFDAATRRLGPPRRLTLDANGNLAEAWTLDSDAILFVSNRHGTWKLFRQAVDETTAETLVEGRSLFLPRLSPDGSQILYLSYTKPEDTSQPVTLMRVPVAGGPSQPVLRDVGITNHQCASFSFHLCVYSKLEGSKNIFVSFDLEHGAGHALLSTDHFTNWSLSRDGTRLALFLSEHVIRFVDMPTGTARDVSVKDWPLQNGDWSADGKSIHMQSVTSTGTPVILDVDSAGKAIIALEGAATISFKWLVPSPDGRSAILEAEVPGDNNVWLLDNF